MKTSTLFCTIVLGLFVVTAFVPAGRAQRPARAPEHVATPDEIAAAVAAVEAAPDSAAAHEGYLKLMTSRDPKLAPHSSKPRSLNTRLGKNSFPIRRRSPIAPARYSTARRIRAPSRTW